MAARVAMPNRGVCAAGASAASRPSVYSDVRITFAGETFALLGVQTSFSESRDGGRIVFS